MNETKTQLPCLDIPITRTCNKNCAGCYYMSPCTKGHYYPEKIVKECSSASATLEANGFFRIPKQIQIVGGEPFLHPQFTEVLSSIRQIWDTETLVFTNGLDYKQPLNYVDILRQYDCKIMVSAHSETDVLRAEKLRADFHELSVRAEVNPSFTALAVKFFIVSVLRA